MSRHARPVTLPPRVHAILLLLSRQRKLERRLAERVQMALWSADGVTSVAQARRLGVDVQRVSRWRWRLSASSARLASAAGAAPTDEELEQTVLAILADAHRSGVKPKFSAEQLTRIVALACKAPKDFGIPVTHWTPRELAIEAAKQGIVESISPRHLARFLDEADLKPHRSQYWLNPTIDDPLLYAAQVEEICELYKRAPELLAAGVRVISGDEKTGIQALELAAPTIQMSPGRVERREYEYIRHGTQCLTANFEVATGKVISPTLATTRNEQDFAEHIRRTIASDIATTRWVFILDGLNTHFSESLVRLVAEGEPSALDLGTKGKDGILENVESRRAYLTAEIHRVRFVYTPKHCSWMNQVEIWFSILSRRALKRASFRSIEEMNKAILDFIDYFNAVLAKPFRWTFSGRPLMA